jgi:hypothetical protein
MNAQLRKALIKRFSAGLTQELPQFVQAEVPGAPGKRSIIYVWELKDDFCFFLELLPSPKTWEHSFIVELAWNTSREYPRVAMGKWMGGMKSPENSPYGLFRLPVLYKDKWESKTEPWWWLGPEPVKLTAAERAAVRATVPNASITERTAAMLDARDKKEGGLRQEDVPVELRVADVEFKVNDAVDKIKKYGLPYMKQVAAAHKIRVHMNE